MWHTRQIALGVAGPDAIKGSPVTTVKFHGCVFIDEGTAWPEPIPLRLTLSELSRFCIREYCDAPIQPRQNSFSFPFWCLRV